MPPFPRHRPPACSAEMHGQQAAAGRSTAATWSTKRPGSPGDRMAAQPGQETPCGAHGPRAGTGVNATAGGSRCGLAGSSMPARAGPRHAAAPVRALMLGFPRGQSA